MPLSPRNLAVYNRALRLDLLRYRKVKRKTGGSLKAHREDLDKLNSWLCRAAQTFVVEELCIWLDLTDRCRECMDCLKNVPTKKFIERYPEPAELLRHWDKEIRVSTIVRLSGRPATSWRPEIPVLLNNIYRLR